MRRPFVSIVLMTAAGAALATFGFTQFGAVGITADRQAHAGAASDTGAGQAAQRALALYGGEVKKVEREREHGRDLYEIKLVDAEGRRREVLVDASSGEVVGKDR